MRKISRRPSINQEKICNICGEYVLVYSVVDNAPLCEDCVPTKKMKKAIPNEANMINKLLNKKIENQKLLEIRQSE